MDKKIQEFGIKIADLYRYPDRKVGDEREEFPQIKKKLWSGHLWSAGYYVASLLKFKKKEVEGDNQLFLI